jgi:hypothetical protein
MVVDSGLVNPCGIYLLVLYLAEEFGKGNTKFLGRKWGWKIPSL